MNLRRARAAPLSLTRFFGRERASADLMDVVHGSRLVTLVGAPGCGKTRLGVEVGARLADRLPARVVFVELSSIGDPSLVPSAVAAAVGVGSPPDRPVEDALVEALATDETLVVLDTCEHLRDAIGDLVARLLGGCPSLRIMATSRRVLGLPGEHVWRLPPLDLGSAVDLFRDRAGLRAPDGSVEASGAETVEQICRRLDCLPLAIELVAAWSRVLTPTEILDRLGSASPLLRGHLRDADARHLTMADAVTWSYQLLEPTVQLLFEQLSTFAGGFDLDAAQAIATGDHVLDGLAVLVDHSLVVAAPTPAGVMRYRLLETVRQCAESRLAADGRLEGNRRRHAEHYLEVALRSDAELRRGNPAAAIDRLKDDDANFGAALAWSREQPDDLGLRLSTALATSWALRGCVDEGRAWIDEMRHLRAGTDDRRLRASGPARASCLAWRQHDHPSSRALLESLAIACEQNDSSCVARRLAELVAAVGGNGETQAGPTGARELTARRARSTSDELLRAALGETEDDGEVPLSPRELEIAELVARGLTNKEIAQHLIISTRTVESHVNHIKTKLGFSRRARIVAWVLGREPAERTP